MNEHTAEVALKLTEALGRAVRAGRIEERLEDADRLVCSLRRRRSRGYDSLGSGQ